ncbi:MAG: patatin-like phospholipase family protein [Bdellovibrionales bacterium]
MSQKDPIIVLFNYGGGMRGLIPAHIMAAIEEKTGLRMADMVDVFAGPSTGAILNAALNVPHPEDPTQPKYRARHMVRFYEREGPKIFPRDRFRDFRGFIHDFNNRTMKIGQLNNLMRHGHYDPAHLSYCLQALYGDKRLEDSLRSLIIPVYNIDGAQLPVAQEDDETTASPVHTRNNFTDGGGHAVWLKHMRLTRNPQPVPQVSLHDAIMGSTAAPTYFPCHHFKARHPTSGKIIEYSGIDGSIFDNPCISYHGAMRQHLPDDRPVIMILLGTGYTLRSFNKDQWNSYGGLGVVDPVNDLPLINILFHAPESALVESFYQELGEDNLYVFNKVVAGAANAPSLSIDDASPENFKRMELFARETIEDNAAKFDSLCDFLAATHDRRKRDGYTLEKSKKKGFWDIFK